MSWGWLWLAGACSSSSPTLVLDGPPVVKVDRLGPVQGPKVVLEDGTHPTGVIWSLSREGVAHLQGDQVVAYGPGEVDVVAEWEGARVEWTLVVELATMLTLVDPPSTLKVGESRPVAIQARAGERQLAPAAVEWTVSDPAVLRVDGQGTLVGVGPGVGYVTARVGGAFAMAQIEVIP
jgi:hypothetical protein